jgi:hypothetical protein
MVSMVRCVAFASRSDSSGPLASLPSMLIRLHVHGIVKCQAQELARLLVQTAVVWFVPQLYTMWHRCLSDVALPLISPVEGSSEKGS